MHRLAARHNVLRECDSASSILEADGDARAGSRETRLPAKTSLPHRNLALWPISKPPINETPLVVAEPYGSSRLRLCCTILKSCHPQAASRSESIEFDPLEYLPFLAGLA